MKLLGRLRRNQRGTTSVAALILMYAIIIFGSIVGLVTLRDQIVQEFGDLAAALDHLDQSWSIPGKAGYKDHRSLPDSLPGQEPAGLNVQVPPLAEGASP